MFRIVLLLAVLLECAYSLPVVHLTVLPLQAYLDSQVFVDGFISGAVINAAKVRTYGVYTPHVTN
jgi:hypothetical protein